MINLLFWQSSVLDFESINEFVILHIAVFGNLFACFFAIVVYVVRKPSLIPLFPENIFW